MGLLENIETINDYLSFRGMRVHYRVMRQEDGPIRRRVLLLNSPLSSMFNWRLLIPELLSQDCLIAQVDLPGYGQSDCGRGVPQDANTRAQLIWGVLDEIDAFSSYSSQYWHLISHGSSCLTTMTMAQQAPECVASEVFISPLLQAPVAGFYRTIFGKSRLNRTIERWYYDSIMNRSGLQAQLNEWFGRPVPAYVLDAMRRSLIRPGMKPQLLRLVHEGFIADPEIYHGFTPMMAIWGQRDPLFTETHAAAFRKALPNVEAHVLHTAAHYPQETHSKAVCDYLRGWLKFTDG